MDLVSKYQGVVGRVFGNENSGAGDDSHVERLLDRISNGSLSEDRRTAITELQSFVAESGVAQLAFGATGFPVLLSILKEERDDIEMVRGALETLLSALTPLDYARGPKTEVQPALMNSDLLSREVENISLLISLLLEDDFYVRYYTLQLLTVLLTNSPNRIQEAILTIPCGLTRLMDMLVDREVIRNEALLLLTYLTREAEEIQKIVVFEGAFEKIFSIVKEEGGAEGGVVVQDCLELLNNLIHRNESNQVLLRETLGFDPLISILKLRGSTYKFTQQKTTNLLSALGTINFLIAGVPGTETEKDANRFTNKTIFVQKKLLDHLLMLGVESQWAPVALRCAALRCIGDLIANHPRNLDAFASKVLGGEPQTEPALHSLLRILLRTSSVQEFIAADYVFRIFCEKNPDAQIMLASTLSNPPYTGSTEDETNWSFGRLMMHGLKLPENAGDLETCCRVANLLSCMMKDNKACKERVLKIQLDENIEDLGAWGPDYIMHRIMKYLAIASSMTSKDGESTLSGNLHIQPFILKLLIIWLYDCPVAVQFFLDARPHLTYLLELVSNSSTTVYVRGLTAILLGECVIYNKSTESTKDAPSIVDVISQKVGLTSYFSKLEEMQKCLPFSYAKPIQSHKPLARSTAASMAEIQDEDKNDSTDQKNEYHPMLLAIFDFEFFKFLKTLEADIREKILEIYSNPRNKVTVMPAELEKMRSESDRDYIERLRLFAEKQCSEIQDLLSRNAILAEDLAKKGGGDTSQIEYRASGGSERVQLEKLRRELQEASQRVEILKADKAKVESEALMYQNLAGKMESDLKSLSDAYNSLEWANIQLEKEVGALRSGKSVPLPDVEAIKAEAREEAQKECEVELNDLLVCLGQEQSKVERLSARLLELGEDVDKLLEGIGDDIPEDAAHDDGDDD